jgi:hypothetical protein
MKRIIAAVSFAILAAPAFAAESGAPYDQNLVDRALPNVQNPVVEEATGVWAEDYSFIAPAQ